MNKVNAAWAADTAVVAGWMQTDSVLQAEALATCGYDAIVLDLQHSVTSFERAVAMLAAIESKGVEPFVRVQWNDAGDIMRLLDAGAYGIIAPMIETAAQARALVSAAHYPPSGTRSFGPRRPMLRYGADYLSKADQTIVTMAMIETRKGLDHLDEIAAVEGLDGIFIGPADLAMALGAKPEPESNDPGVKAAIQKVLSTTKAAGKKVGIFCGSGASAARRIEQGFDFVSATPDLVMVMAAARASVELARENQVTV